MRTLLAVTAAMVGFVATAAHSSVITYQFENTYFYGGAMVTGTFDFNTVTDGLTNVNVSTTPDTEYAAPAFTFNQGHVGGYSAPNAGSVFVFVATVPGAVFALDFGTNTPGYGHVFFYNDLNGYGNLSALSLNGTYLNPPLVGFTYDPNGLEGFDDEMVPGGGVVSTTPLPASLPMFAGGLAGLGVLGYRRARRMAV